MEPQPVTLESQNARNAVDSATIDPTKGEEDARVQERGIRPKISLGASSNKKYLRHPTSSYLSKNAPSLPGIGHAGMA
jgi:hypothetical protein